MTGSRICDCQVERLAERAHHNPREQAHEDGDYREAKHRARHAEGPAVALLLAEVTGQHERHNAE
ncbi:hypothetical protein D3C71_1983030 [compost metagenome]